MIPYTLGNYLANADLRQLDGSEPEFQAASDEVKEKIQKLFDVKGYKPVDEFHRELGLMMWDKCGMSRKDSGLKDVLKRIPEIREDFWTNVKVPGVADEFNQELEKAMRVADFLEFAELMAKDALVRNESCGGHFREESQSDDGEALRKDDEFTFVSAWEFNGVGNEPSLHKEELSFEEVTPSTRSYK